MFVKRAAIAVVIFLGLIAASELPALEPINPFSLDEGVFSISISKYPDGAYDVNYWGRLKPNVDFDSLPTFSKIYHADINNMPPELVQDAKAIAYDRILPWFRYEEGVYPNQTLVLRPIVVQCRPISVASKEDLIAAQTFVCRQHIAVALGPAATVAEIVDHIVQSLPPDALYYFETANEVKSPAQSFSSMVANGKAPSDEDGDGIYDSFDNCASLSNPAQDDADSDGVGDACEDSDSKEDLDRDGIEDESDRCPGTAEGDVVDADGCSEAQLATIVQSDSDEGVAASAESESAAGQFDLKGFDSTDGCSLVAR